MFRIVNRLVVVDARGYRVARRQRVAPRNIAQHLKHIPLGSVGRFPNISHQYEGYQRKNAKKKTGRSHIHESWTFMWGCHVTRAWRGHWKHWFSLIYIYNLCRVPRLLPTRHGSVWNYHLGSVPTARHRKSSLDPYDGSSTLPSTNFPLPKVFLMIFRLHTVSCALQQQLVTLDSAIGAKASASVSTGRCWMLVAVGMVVTHVRKRHLQPKLFEGTRYAK